MARASCAIAASCCLLLFVHRASAQVGSVKRAQEISPTAGGFGGQLGLFDGFGNALASLGDLDGDGVVDLAVGAKRSPDGGSFAGSVWILFLKADGTVKAEQKISETAGGFGVDLPPFAYFGSAAAPLGDLDGDGIVDLAVGSFGLSAIWILFLEADGTVRSHQEIAAGAGGFDGDIASSDFFGTSLAQLGDLDGDGVVDLAVGADSDDDGAAFSGAVWILFMNTDGTVKAEQKISATQGGFGGLLRREDLFGTSLAALGDLDGDGFLELAVGARGDDDGGSGGSQRGAVWILSLNRDGTVRSWRKLSASAGSFGGDLSRNDFFGYSVSALGDLDADGITDLAVGANQDDDGGGGIGNQGAVWILLLDRDGSVKAERKISATSGGFAGYLREQDFFGSSIHCLGDLDGDGVVDLAVGAIGDGPESQGFRGALWILFLEGAPPCFRFDFETEDDLVSPLVNGQHIDAEFGALMALTSSGSNAGLAIFDSTPGGPNDPSQDPDLLVGSGNLLILQTENFPPDGNDVFPRPNDDEDGGTITFEFAVPVEPRGLRLVDVDAADGPTTVVLEDGQARRRTYTVPGNWTGDHTLAQPGQGALVLTTRTAQPGFGSTTLASEEDGFDPTGVVRLDVHLGGSAGLDDLELCSEHLPRATALPRTGSGVNPSILAPAALPVLGSTWTADLDCSALDPGLAILELRSQAVSRRTPSGEVLIGGALQYRVLRPYSGSASRFTWNLPRNLALCGLELYAQGLCREQSSGPSAGKALRARERLSNALDLVLGF